MSEIPHADDWQDHYPTTTSRGQQQYSVPGGWILASVEAGGVRWKRYENIGAECRKDYEVTEARDYSKNAGTPSEDVLVQVIEGRRPSSVEVRADGDERH